MKSIVQRLSPSKSGRMSKRLSSTPATVVFNGIKAPIDGVAIEVVADRLIVQDNEQTNLKGFTLQEIQDIEWNYEEMNVRFSLVDESLLIVSLPTLNQFEDCLTNVLQEAKLNPAMTYVGIFSGAKQPRILQQKRATLLPPNISRPKIQLAKRRELLLQDRPPQLEISRESLCSEFIRDLKMTFMIERMQPTEKLTLNEAQIIFEGATTTELIVTYDMIIQCKKRNRNEVDLELQDNVFSFGCSAAHHLCHAIWYFMNKRGKLIPESAYGRAVYKPENPHDTIPPALTTMLQYDGTLSKTASEGFHLTQSWKKKHACVYETPLGAWLYYYDSAACASEKRESNKSVDLSSVVCIRPQSCLPDAPKYSFDIVTLYRTWSFCAPSELEWKAWLHVLKEFVDRCSALVPDTPLACEVKLSQISQEQENGPSVDAGSATLSIAAHGVSLNTVGSSTSNHTWYYTDIHKWSLVLQPTPSLYMNCFIDEQCTAAGEFLLQTKNAAALCQAIEFHVAKCLAKVDALLAADAPPPIPRKSEMHTIQVIELPPSPVIHQLRRVTIKCQE